MWSCASSRYRQAERQEVVLAVTILTVPGLPPPAFAPMGLEKVLGARRGPSLGGAVCCASDGGLVVAFSSLLRSFEGSRGLHVPC